VDYFMKQWPSAEMYLSIIPMVVGTYVSGSSATSTQACSSAVYDGAARCHTAEGWLFCVFPLNSSHFLYVRSLCEYHFGLRLPRQCRSGYSRSAIRCG
jgi:hypothetical protein